MAARAIIGSSLSGTDFLAFIASYQFITNKMAIPVMSANTPIASATLTNWGCDASCRGFIIVAYSFNSWQEAGPGEVWGYAPP